MFEWTIENNEAFQRKLDELGKKTSDFRIPFRLIASDFYRSQKEIFQLNDEGLYNPLGGFNYNQTAPNGLTRRENAENAKERKVKRPWAPILFGETGDLKDSTLTRSHRYSIFILGKQELNIGTSVPYGKFHQSDSPRTKIPQRKFIFITGGSGDKSKSNRLFGRRERWTSIIDTHLQQLISGSI